MIIYKVDGEMWKGVQVDRADSRWGLVPSLPRERRQKETSAIYCADGALRRAGWIFGSIEPKIPASLLALLSLLGLAKLLLNL